jgi:hypothetical protein
MMDPGGPKTYGCGSGTLLELKGTSEFFLFSSAKIVIIERVYFENADIF